VGYVSDGEKGIPVLDSGPAIADAFVERFLVEPAASGPLHGTSFAVKDIFAVAGRSTDCGNPTWRATHSPATHNAAALEILLNAGARLLGKTRTDELAYSLDGCNVHEGAPINPAAPDRLTGGSSSGPASAVATGEVDFCLASDTAGSVRVPAAWCGLAGMRPTHARISVAGLSALAPSFDAVGWLARSGSMMRRVGTVLFGPGARPSPSFSLVRDLSVEACATDVESAAWEQMIRRCVSQGFAVGEVSLAVDLDSAAECLRVLQGGEVWAVHGQWVEAAKPRFGPGVAERFIAARAITAGQVRAAAQARAALAAALDAALPPGRILCLPTVPGPAPRRNASAEELQLRRSRLLPLTALASLTGRPQITVPLAAAGAPVGFSLLGWRWGDEALLEIAERLFP
jgi:amidase